MSLFESHLSLSSE
jgi:hypothetical protein